MKRKMIVAVCLILILGFSASLRSAENIKIKVFPVVMLDRDVKMHLRHELNDSVIMTPLQSYSDRAKQKFTLTLNFSSPREVLGYSLYIFSSGDFSVKFVHQDQWYSLWANRPTAGREVVYDFGRRQRFTRLRHSKLLGVVLNKEQQDLGDIIIETNRANSFAFVFYVYILKDENALPEQEEDEGAEP